jgi:hypothetical protein
MTFTNEVYDPQFFYLFFPVDGLRLQHYLDSRTASHPLPTAPKRHETPDLWPPLPSRLKPQPQRNRLIGTTVFPDALLSFHSRSQIPGDGTGNLIHVCATPGVAPPTHWKMFLFFLNSLFSFSFTRKSPGKENTQKFGLGLIGVTVTGKRTERKRWPQRLCIIALISFLWPSISFSSARFIFRLK